jgi:hypothetical protein
MQYDLEIICEIQNMDTKWSYIYIYRERDIINSKTESNFVITKFHHHVKLLKNSNSAFCL